MPRERQRELRRQRKRREKRLRERRRRRAPGAQPVQAQVSPEAPGGAVPTTGEQAAPAAPKTETGS